eukprot:gene19326-biopygen11526
MKKPKHPVCPPAGALTSPPPMPARAVTLHIMQGIRQRTRTGRGPHDGSQRNGHGPDAGRTRAWPFLPTAGLFAFAAPRAAAPRAGAGTSPFPVVQTALRSGSPVQLSSYDQLHV